MKTIRTISVLCVAVALLLVACSQNEPTRTERKHTAVAVTLLKSSLVESVERITMSVVQNDQVIHRDTVEVIDGSFSFPPFDLDAGSATFTVNALDANNLVVYTRTTTVDIEADRNNSIILQLLPALPMLKLSPYWVTTQTGAPFVSRVELYNIARFHSGDFQVNFNRQFIRFDSIRASGTAWGVIEYGASDYRTYLDVNVTRVGNSDVAPANAPALVDLWFTALSAGTTDLTIAALEIVDNNGTIVELEDSNFITDGQTIHINQVSAYGMLSGTVSNAATGGPLDSVNVAVVGPTQRSTRTGAEGAFSFAELPYGSYQVTASKPGFIQSVRTIQVFQPVVTTEFVLTQILDPNQYRAVLTWGDQPSDLDLHLWTLQTEIYFSHKGSLDTTPYALLDVDEQNGHGPETITIGQLLDTCKFSVHNYSVSPEITISQAHIDLYKGQSLLRSFDIPTSGSGGWWYVFDLTPSGVVVDKNVIIDGNPAVVGAPVMPVKLRQ